MWNEENMYTAAMTSITHHKQQVFGLNTTKCGSSIQQNLTWLANGTSLYLQSKRSKKSWTRMLVIAMRI